MLQWLKDKPTPQLDMMDKMPVEDRDFVSAIMDSVTMLRNTLRSDSNMLMSQKVPALIELADRLRAQADLIIPTVSLCTKVDGFGVYEPVEPARFTAMKEHPIIVYCEVENFSSHQNEKKMWETKLSQEVVLYTETGLPVWQDKTENIPDLARNRRHDFFVVKKTKFPPNITIGRYLLKVTIVASRRRGWRRRRCRWCLWRSEGSGEKIEDGGWRMEGEFVLRRRLGVKMGEQNLSFVSDSVGFCWVRSGRARRRDWVRLAL